LVLVEQLSSSPGDAQAVCAGAKGKHSQGVPALALAMPDWAALVSDWWFISICTDQVLKEHEEQEDCMLVAGSEAKASESLRWHCWFIAFLREGDEHVPGP